MNELMEKENVKIENMIYEIRGIQVMLDSDLAKLYECKNGTKEINQAVNRNPLKFPQKYTWVLTDEESNDFLVTNCDQKIETRGGRYKNPRVFTEQAVAMLATILRTPKAIQTSLAIMDAFVSMRHYLINNRNIFESINNINNKLMNYDNKKLDYDEKFNYLFSKFDKKEEVIIKGKVYDGYSLILNILSNAKCDVIIIDSYADYKLLDLIRNIKCNVILITKNSKRLSNIEIDKYNMEYDNLKVFRDNNIHDRYFVIDRHDIYLLGTSINSIGEKMTTLVKLQEENVINTINKMINEIMEVVNE